jgi:hypothetical protein
VWDARIEALIPILGKPLDVVYHSHLPIHLGGFADVLAFPSFVPGMTYVTADLTGGDVGQLANSLGTYELMVCLKEELTRAADLISRLARYTCEAVLGPGHTMDLPDFFNGSVIRALLFAVPGETPLQFSFGGKTYGLLLCVGITEAELAFKNANGASRLVALLKERGVFPYTILQRESVVP